MIRENWKSWNLVPVCPGDDRVAPRRESGESRAAGVGCGLLLAPSGNVVEMILEVEEVEEGYHQ